jgi:hypothetical protein
MALHKREDSLSILDTGIYGAEAMGHGVPRYRMPLEGLRPDIAHALVSNELILAGNAQQNLAIFTGPSHSTSRSGSPYKLSSITWRRIGSIKRPRGCLKRQVVLQDRLIEDASPPF